MAHLVDPGEQGGLVYLCVVGFLVVASAAVTYLFRRYDPDRAGGSCCVADCDLLCCLQTPLPAPSLEAGSRLCLSGSRDFIIYECDKVACMCAKCEMNTKLMFNAINASRSTYDVGHVKWVLTTVPVDIYNVWNALCEDGRHVWTNYSPQLIKLFIRATPETDKLSESALGALRLKYLCPKYIALVHMFFLCTGIAIQRKMIFILSLYQELPNDLQNVMREIQKEVQPLQHLSRLAIRKNIRPNMFYGVSKLNIPKKYQRFLCCEEGTAKKIR